MLEQLREFLKNDPFYNDALFQVRRNSRTNQYLVGGYLYRFLLHGSVPEGTDMDFVVGSLLYPLHCNAGWTVTQNKFGHERFVKGNKSVDPIQLDKHVYIKKKNLPRTIDSYLASVPFTIQAVAYDTIQRRLIGDVGLKAIADRKFGINNQEELEYCCRNYDNRTPMDLIIKKADSLGIDYVL